MSRIVALVEPEIDAVERGGERLQAGPCGGRGRRCRRSSRAPVAEPCRCSTSDSRLGLAAEHRVAEARIARRHRDDAQADGAAADRGSRGQPADEHDVLERVPRREESRRSFPVQLVPAPRKTVACSRAQSPCAARAARPKYIVVLSAAARRMMPTCRPCAAGDEASAMPFGDSALYRVRPDAVVGVGVDAPACGR